MRNSAKPSAAGAAASSVKPTLISI